MGHKIFAVIFFAVVIMGLVMVLDSPAMQALLNDEALEYAGNYRELGSLEEGRTTLRYAAGHDLLGRFAQHISFGCCELFPSAHAVASVQFVRYLCHVGKSVAPITHLLCANPSYSPT